MTTNSDNSEAKNGIDDRSLTIEERRLYLEKRKLEADIELRKLELNIKGQGSGWLSNFTPLTTTLLAGVLTLAGSVVGTILQGRQTLQLEETKFNLHEIWKKKSLSSQKTAI